TVTSSGRIPVRMTGVVALNVYLLGVDSTVDPGRYLLAGRSADGETLFERELEVLPRAFRREEIPLDSNLTALRSEPDPRKTEQTRILSDLILSRDPGALYHAGPLEWPLPPDTRRTSLFGDRRTFVYTDGRRAGAIHVGLDFAAPVGTPIVSSGTGGARMARDRIVTGNTVVIEHLPGVYSMYYHLDEIDVEEGVLVATGQPIGTVGATGLATGPHLHWEIRVGGVPVSPERVMNQPLLLGALTP
ncbi:MAG: M23 family metallopeptidase, partial [Spirochaetota bacterium]